ncbi:hypothetical protein AVEN_20481-1 [Araneus ventricosus]|uniref:Uncharacterized protein n=1 Tax=Araneus ventricosus TaxID=182803 RepID=A0A4Y2RUM4_ARAVE|nr:hypothetical protein AVEN_20481-1 [Araneus ventricosus]
MNEKDWNNFSFHQNREVVVARKKDTTFARTMVSFSANNTDVLAAVFHQTKYSNASIIRNNWGPDFLDNRSFKKKSTRGCVCETAAGIEGRILAYLTQL